MKKQNSKDGKSELKPSYLKDFKSMKSQTITKVHKAEVTSLHISYDNDS